MANKPTGVINIHGREYETVALRVKRFREAHYDWAITTEILHRDADVVIMRASIATDGGRVVATGHAEEWRRDGQINRTSAIENCETSCIGRALASLGMGGTEFASANEIEVAKAKDKAESPYEKHSARQTAQDEFDALPEDAQAIVREWALDVIATVEDGRVQDAHEFVGRNCVSAEDKLALWSQLPSNVRSALKKHQQEKQNASV